MHRAPRSRQSEIMQGIYGAQVAVTGMNEAMPQMDRTIVEIYQKPREEKLRTALAQRGAARSARGNDTTTNDNQDAAASAAGVQEVLAVG